MLIEESEIANYPEPVYANLINIFKQCNNTQTA
jgi:hypothetical protein